MQRSIFWVENEKKDNNNTRKRMLFCGPIAFLTKKKTTHTHTHKSTAHLDECDVVLIPFEWYGAIQMHAMPSCAICLHKQMITFQQGHWNDDTMPWMIICTLNRVHARRYVAWCDLFSFYSFIFHTITFEIPKWCILNDSIKKDEKLIKYAIQLVCFCSFALSVDI